MKKSNESLFKELLVQQTTNIYEVCSNDSNDSLMEQFNKEVELIIENYSSEYGYVVSVWVDNKQCEYYTTSIQDAIENYDIKNGVDFYKIDNELVVECHGNDDDTMLYFRKATLVEFNEY